MQFKFVYINGLGGIGKTTLLNQFYHEIKRKMGQGFLENTKIFIWNSVQIGQAH